MEQLLLDKKLELFFGVLILFFSFTGILGYVAPTLIINPYFLVVFFLGVMLGALLVQSSLLVYFGRTKTGNIVKLKRRR